MWALSRNLRRMFFQDGGLKKLEEVDFGCFSNVIVLKVRGDKAIPLQLNLSGLKHLQSLDLELRKVNDSPDGKSQTFVGLNGLSSLSKLRFLRLSNISSDSQCIDEIDRLTKLEVLDLSGGGQLPNMRNLVLLRVACFRKNNTAITITGLSSKHTNLSFLYFDRCYKLQSCPGVGELIALQELCFNLCEKLKMVPNLQKLKGLQALNVNCCRSLNALLGLGDLVSLQTLRVSVGFDFAELPDLYKLINLRLLDLYDCYNVESLSGLRNLSNLKILSLFECPLIKSLPGLDELVCLQTLRTWGCKNLTQLPDICKLTNLQTLELDPDCPLQSDYGLSDLISLQILMVGFDELCDWPDLHKLTKLETLFITGWQAQGFSNLANFVLLKSVTVHKCKGVCVLPNLQRLTRLHKLKFRYCEFEDMSSLSNLTSVRDLRIKDCNKLEVKPDLHNLVSLKSLRIVRCSQLREFRGALAMPNLESLCTSRQPWLHLNLGLDLCRLTGVHELDVSHVGFADLQVVAACLQLKRLTCCGCPIQELPDLANFPKLYHLDVNDCVNLTKLTCMGPLSAKLELLNVKGCRSLKALPDLTNVEKLVWLNVANSGVLMSPQLIMRMKTRWPNI